MVTRTFVYCYASLALGALYNMERHRSTVGNNNSGTSRTLYNVLYIAFSSSALAAF